MNKNLLIIFAMIGLFAITENVNANSNPKADLADLSKSMPGSNGGGIQQFYRIISVNSGVNINEYLQPGEKFIGYIINRSSPCNGAKVMMGHKTCALITATPPEGFVPRPGIVPGTETFYTIRPSTTGFVGQVIIDGQEMSVDKANNY